jgi:DNA polymerase III epsilon subunit-like protein
LEEARNLVSFYSYIASGFEKEPAGRLMQAMANAYGISGHGQPLFFFYDCEATGRQVKHDNIIEVAAVLHTQHRDPRLQEPHSFSSLCKTSRKLHREVEQLTGLTKHSLRNEPSIEEVLDRFFNWIKNTVAAVNGIKRRPHIPVLAAHGGHLLDFPLLLTTVANLGTRKPALLWKFNRLNLHYVNTQDAIKQWSETRAHALRGLGLRDVYEDFFQCPLEGHRALPDASALHKVFSEARPADELMALLGHLIQSREGLKVEKEQRGLFKHVKGSKITELLQKNITYQDFVEESRNSEESFVLFLRERCGITDPDRKLINHFRAPQQRPF